MAKVSSFNIDPSKTGDDYDADLGPAHQLILKGNYASVSTTSAYKINQDTFQLKYSTDGGVTWQTAASGDVSFNWGSGYGVTGSGSFQITINGASAAAMANKSVSFQIVQSDLPAVTETGADQFSIACFYAGTMISTPTGLVAVEDLKIGDMVTRHDGADVPVRWMGRNTVMRMFADPNKVLPIRIKKDALEANVPSRDLLVSPDHAMFVDGILAQAGALVNGTSIVRENNAPGKFTYHHIELAEHALIVAESAPTESFVDNIDRMAYDNWAEHEALYGELPALVEMDLPRAKSQRQVPAATRQRLAARAVELGYSVVDAAVA